MATYEITVHAKSKLVRTKVEGRRFRVSIGGADFWMVVHEDPGVIGSVVVSDLRSGFRFTRVGPLHLQACRGDRVSAGKMAVSAFLADRTDHAHIRKVIEQAQHDQARRERA